MSEAENQANRGEVSARQNAGIPIFMHLAMAYFREATNQTIEMDPLQDAVACTKQHTILLQDIFTKCNVSEHFKMFATLIFQPNPTNLVWITNHWDQRDNETLQEIQNAINNSQITADEKKTLFNAICALIFYNFRICRETKLEALRLGEQYPEVTLNDFNCAIRKAAKTTTLTDLKLSEVINNIKTLKQETETETETSRQIKKTREALSEEHKQQLTASLESYFTQFQERITEAKKIFTQRQKEIRGLTDYLQKNIPFSDPSRAVIQAELAKISAIFEYVEELNSYTPFQLYALSVSTTSSFNNDIFTDKNITEARHIIAIAKIMEFIHASKDVQRAIAANKHIHEAILAWIKPVDKTQDLDISIARTVSITDHLKSRTCIINQQTIQLSLDIADPKDKSILLYAFVNSSSATFQEKIANGDIVRGQAIISNEDFNSHTGALQAFLEQFAKENLGLSKSNDTNYKNITGASYKIEVKERPSGYKDIKLYYSVYVDENGKIITKTAYENARDEDKAKYHAIRGEFRIIPHSTYQIDKGDTIAGHDVYGGRRPLDVLIATLNSGEDLNRARFTKEKYKEQFLREQHPKWRTIKQKYNFIQTLMEDEDATEDTFEAKNTLIKIAITTIEQLINTEANHTSNSLLLQDLAHLKAYCGTKISGANSAQAYH